MNINSNNFNVDENGNLKCTNANVTGKIVSNDATITGGKIRIKSNKTTSDSLRVESSNDEQTFSYIQPIGAGFVNSNGNNVYIFVDKRASLDLRDSEGYTELSGGGIRTPKLTQTSIEEDKKNFQKYSTIALKEIKKIDIYKYNLKSEEDTDKKHIGFVIGDKYNYSKEITSVENDGVDVYSFTSLCCKAIQEQQDIIEQLDKRINFLEKGGKLNG